MADGARRGRRRLRWGVAGVSCVVVATGAALTDGGHAGAAVSAGQGSSYAQALQVTPHEGSLAVGAVFGEALAGNTGNYARAQSQGLDLGAIGTSMKSYNCGQAPQPAVAHAVPAPLEAEAGQPGADQGMTATNPQQTYGATEFAKANASPYAEAQTTFQSVQGGLINATGAHSKAWSGTVGGQRVAAATADIGSVNLAAGAVVLDGLHWDAAFPSGGSGRPNGTFTVARATVGGKPVPTADLSALQSAANQVLGTYGIKLVLPHVTEERGIEAVSPLEVEVVPNSNRDTLVDAGLNAVGPTYSAVTGGLENGFGSWEPSQLEQALCQSDTPITVVDITLASISGAGYFNAAFGGVHASSAGLATNAFNLSLPSFSLGGGSSQFVPGTPGTAGGADLGGSGFSNGTSLSSPSSSSAPSAGATGSPAHSTGVLAAAVGRSAGGPLLALGLAGLVSVALLAEADRRTMRRARQARFEE